jgi:hypothetical protein
MTVKISFVRTFAIVIAIAVASSSLVATAGAATVTRLTVVDSSPTSWVARGLEDYTVSPELGWTFTPSRNFDNGIGFQIEGPALPGTSIDEWFLNFAAPFNAELAPGLYTDFQRFPFQDADRPGLEFGSTGRLDNRASGFFEILEVSYDSLGNVLTFSADFTHFGEENPSNFAIVELRYNATVIPEPASVALSAFGLVGVVGLVRRASRTRRS